MDHIQLFMIDSLIYLIFIRFNISMYRFNNTCYGWNLLASK